MTSRSPAQFCGNFAGDAEMVRFPLSSLAVKIDDTLRWKIVPVQKWEDHGFAHECRGGDRKTNQVCCHAS